MGVFYCLALFLWISHCSVISAEREGERLVWREGASAFGGEREIDKFGERGQVCFEEKSKIRI